eukprot:CAMPEP_0177656012 /NCGR_PEP_ID=MMETSP0447-20121125/15305_1 /TAXON_ID=0 /ORGANISM="Stygamoeba regulata, Strain BSH-02190019" /LENGTH=336 /DNA_ID=CAMNT_0019160033 /DNA_START=187 /DNA_END=1197 /DNA_ORIENTATION=+
MADSATDETHTTLYREAHVSYINSCNSNKEDFAYWVTEHLRISGFYWGLSALALLGRLDDTDRTSILEFAASCRTACGGYGGNRGHDAHLLYTLSAIQVYFLCEAEDRLDVDAILTWVKSLQHEDGSFSGDEWGEIDTRFSYIAISIVHLLKRPDAINLQAAVDYVGRCQNFDGGFGVNPGSESHAGQTFCCVGALAIADRLDVITDPDALGWWLCERQLPAGGLNGRPEKLPDVCYSWWVVSSLSILGRLDWISGEKLQEFILACQDSEGGIADRPGDVVDVYHTFFGIGGLSMTGYPDLVAVDPAFAMPCPLLKRIGLLTHARSDPYFKTTKQA